MTDKQREKMRELIAQHRTPEARAEQQRVRDLLDKEVEETGGITTIDGVFHRVVNRTKRPIETFKLPPDAEIPTAAGFSEEELDAMDEEEAKQG